MTGCAVYAMMQSLGEMATWLPLPGAIPQFCARYVDGAMGFAVGWNVSIRFSIVESRESDGEIELVLMCHHTLCGDIGGFGRHSILERCNEHQCRGLDLSYHPHCRLLEHLRSRHLWRSRVHLRCSQNYDDCRPDSLRLHHRSGWRTYKGQTRIPLLEPPRCNETIHCGWNCRPIPRLVLRLG